MKAWQVEDVGAGTKFWLQLPDGSWAWKNVVPTVHWCHSPRKNYQYAEMFGGRAFPALPAHLVDELHEEFMAAVRAGTVQRAQT